MRGGTMKLSLLMIGCATLFVSVGCSNPTFSEVENKALTNSEEVINEVPPTPVEPVVKAPTLVWVQFPNGPVVTNEDSTIVFDIVPGSSPVVKVECKVDGVVVPCSVDGDTLIVKNPSEGSHVVSIVVTDANNLTDSGSVNWDAFDKFQKVKLPLNIADEEDQVDILVVIDNSVSMKDEQSNMASRISNLLDRVQGLDWQLGIVTTDMKDAKLGDGRLLQFPNKEYYLTSKLSLATAKDHFGKTIQRQENGHHEEQGIKATYRAIQRALTQKETNDKYNKAFFRKKAALAVIVVSDENETGTATANTAAGLASLVKSSFGADKIFKFHSIIVRPGDKACDAIQDHSQGVAYAALTKLTDGVLGDICAKDYGNQLTVIGQDVANTQNTFQLSCTPLDIDGNGVQDVKVSATASIVVPNFTLEKDLIVFSTPPQAGKYSIEYFCPKK